VERFIHVPGTHGYRIDLFGFADIIALCPCRGIVAIQSCGNSFSDHYRKITETDYIIDNCIEWLNCKGCIEIWAWRRVKLKRGGKRMTWKPRIRTIAYDDFTGKYNGLSKINKVGVS
jgi:hypothetical protein